MLKQLVPRHFNSEVQAIPELELRKMRMVHLEKTKRKEESVVDMNESDKFSSQSSLKCA